MAGTSGPAILCASAVRGHHSTIAGLFAVGGFVRPRATDAGLAFLRPRPPAPIDFLPGAGIERKVVLPEWDGGRAG